MNLRKYCLVFLIAISVVSTYAKKKKKEKQTLLPCSELIHAYKSYQHAYLILKGTSFEFYQKKLTDDNSVHKIEYFSCDKKTGYLLLQFNNNTAMIHQNIPVNVWQNMYLQDDPILYYETNIKSNEKYKLEITVETK